MSIEGTQLITEASAHWSRELGTALAGGKTVFVILNEFEEDRGATGSTVSTRNSRNYNTVTINNYSAIPKKLQVRNAKGRRIIVKDPIFKNLFAAISEIAEYRVIFETSTAMRTVFTAKDGTPIGGIVNFESWSGSLVLLPYFDFGAKELGEVSDKDEVTWSKKALGICHALIGQIIAIDRVLKSSADLTPPPNWLNEFAKPKPVADIEVAIAEIDSQIEALRKQRDEKESQEADLLEYSHLLYETGKPLEHAIEKVLRLLGYTVDTLRIGDLEIDHVIVGPSGKRMIGESEGKDTSAVDISKFRQLESNIGEDFEREEVTEHAKGILFGNGFRLSPPANREVQFTQKSLTNANRLGSALVQTSDLYKIAAHLLDNPSDTDFKDACRVALEDTAGGIVKFPATAPMQQ